MWKLFLASPLFLLLYFCACKQEKASSTLISAKNKLNQSGDSILALDFLLEEGPHWDWVEEVEISDPARKSKQRYKAFPLKKVLDIWLQRDSLDVENTSLIFECKDGYSPAISYQKMLPHTAYLSFHSLDTDETQLWPESIKEQFSPFYLVWTDLAKGEKGWPWPYGLTHIRLKNTQNTFAAAKPDPSLALEKGYELFKARCMKCHQINKVGGNMGPELNHPKSITEYMAKADLLAFVQNPQSYRYNSKMPAVLGLKEEELEQIYQYLLHMSSRKISE
ncbi:MAG: cytochrome c [Bacteroidota bacterium]